MVLKTMKEKYTFFPQEQSQTKVPGILFFFFEYFLKNRVHILQNKDLAMCVRKAQQIPMLI